MTRHFWLFKSEPTVYSVHDLETEGTAEWEGVRNYQARNMMRDDIKVGDGVLFYHSNAKPPGVAGLAKVCKAGYPDYSAWDPQSPYFDDNSNPEQPRWFMVDVEHVATFPKLIALHVLKTTPGLEEMLVIRRGMRLSVQPLTKNEFHIISKMGRS